MPLLRFIYAPHPSRSWACLCLPVCSPQQGWYVRITDFEKGHSVAAVVGEHGMATAESFLALLHSFPLLPGPPLPPFSLTAPNPARGQPRSGVRILIEEGTGADTLGRMNLRGVWRSRGGSGEWRLGGDGPCEGAAHSAKCCGSHQRTHVLQSIIQVLLLRLFQ